MPTSVAQLKNHARQIRRMIIETVTPVRASHTGGSLSVVDILVALYFGALQIDPARPDDPKRDLLVLSKGHCALALYCTLIARGFASREALAGYFVDGGSLPGHPVRGCLPGVEVTTGSLGHGLPVAVGLALARKRLGNAGRVFCVLSDGECDEGSTWEAALLAGFQGLDNLIVVIDYNHIQSFGHTAEVLDLEPFLAKWQAFRWQARSVDGHDFPALLDALQALPFAANAPSVLIAQTVKGKGVTQMEHELAWHYRSLDDPADYQRALNDLERS